MRKKEGRVKRRKKDAHGRGKKSGMEGERRKMKK